mmetsp:Transcript_15335/g.59943  ORF Transcript_15335/g.59943 Transcript_15335/m.59943 type:complete len:227 (+) Transcript_15335:545-1225(+)
MRRSARRHSARPWRCCGRARTRSPATHWCARTSPPSSASRLSAPSQTCARPARSSWRTSPARTSASPSPPSSKASLTSSTPRTARFPRCWRRPTTLPWWPSCAGWPSSSAVGRATSSSCLPGTHPTSSSSTISSTSSCTAQGPSRWPGGATSASWRQAGRSVSTWWRCRSRCSRTSEGTRRGWKASSTLRRSCATSRRSTPSLPTSRGGYSRTTSRRWCGAWTRGR